VRERYSNEKKKTQCKTQVEFRKSNSHEIFSAVAQSLCCLYQVEREQLNAQLQRQVAVWQFLLRLVNVKEQSSKENEMDCLPGVVLIRGSFVNLIKCVYFNENGCCYGHSGASSFFPS
jgi:predicted acetyltransferase